MPNATPARSVPRCHACGAGVPPTARFCPACGAELEPGRRATKQGRPYWILAIGTTLAAALGGLALYRLATPPAPPSTPVPVTAPADDASWSGLSEPEAAAARDALDAAIQREEAAARAAVRADGSGPAH